jgi:hypothetical protein
MLDLTEMLSAPAKKVFRMNFVTGTIISVMAVLFLLPALDNGFPFVYPDDSIYLGGGGLSHVPQARSIYYAWFIRVFDLPILVHSSTSQTPWHLKGWSPWPSVALQSLITAWMIWLFASALFTLTSKYRLLLLALLLALGTSLPWFVGQIMPDIFTPLLILALALLWLTHDTLPRVSRMMLVLLISAAVAFHQANLLVALWMLPAFGLCALLGWRPSKASIHGILESGIGLTLGAAALLTANLVDGRFALSNGGSVFLLGRLVGDGTALSYLEKACPQRRFSVCAYLDELSSFRPTMITRFQQVRVADVAVNVLVFLDLSLQSLPTPCSTCVIAEEDASHVVVDADNVEAFCGEKPDGFGSHQPGRARYQYDAHLLLPRKVREQGSSSSARCRPNYSNTSL